MFVLSTAAIDMDGGDFLGTSAHLAEAEMYAYLRSAYDPEDHLAEVPNSELIDAFADMLAVSVIVESRHAPAFHQTTADGSGPVPVIVTPDNELQCPACGHTGSMIRKSTEINTEKVWITTWGGTYTDIEGKTVTTSGRGLDAKGLDTECQESAYECFECETPLDFGDID